MKDKLVKTHHKRGYYITRRFAVVLACTCSLAAIISIPTYVSVKSSEVVNVHAEEDKNNDTIDTNQINPQNA